ncbi:MAG: hypothetical protein WA461_10145 [Nitrososphaeraceae archaeon]
MMKTKAHDPYQVTRRGLASAANQSTIIGGELIGRCRYQKLN